MSGDMGVGVLYGRTDSGDMVVGNVLVGIEAIWSQGICWWGFKRYGRRDSGDMVVGQGFCVSKQRIWL